MSLTQKPIEELKFSDLRVHYGTGRSMVRVLTDAIVSGDVPENLDMFLDQEISKRHKLN